MSVSDELQMFIGYPRYNMRGGNWLAMVYREDTVFFEKFTGLDYNKTDMNPKGFLEGGLGYENCQSNANSYLTNPAQREVAWATADTPTEALEKALVIWATWYPD